MSRAITIVESTNSEHQVLASEIINGVIKHSCKSFRLGITGVPGVGKSTFIESFGKELLNNNHKVAVLAIDPTSSKSKGSILGDKTRMEFLSSQPNLFILASSDQITPFQSFIVQFLYLLDNSYRSFRCFELKNGFLTFFVYFIPHLRKNLLVVEGLIHILIFF